MHSKCCGQAVYLLTDLYSLYHHYNLAMMQMNLQINEVELTFGAFGEF